MKKYFLAFTLIFLCPALLLGRNDRYSSLTITNSNDYFPYSFISEGGQPDGLLIDIWKLWAKKNHVTITFKLVTWNESLELIRTKKVDIHAGLIFSKNRSLYMDFGKLDVPLETAVFISEKLSIDSIDELKNIPVAIQKGDYAVEFIKEHYPKLKLTTYELQKYLLKDLNDDKIFALAYDVPQTMYFINRNRLLGKYRLLERLYSKPLSYSVNKGNKSLINFINTGMEKISKEERDDLNKKWIYYDLPPISIKNLIKWFSATIIVILFLFLTVNYFLLKIQVKRKTKELQVTITDKEKLIDDLQDALSKIKTLRGLIPICSNCKKIRNDNGYWEQVETYIQIHSDADFSHSICPECVVKLYGDQEWFKKRQIKK